MITLFTTLAFLAFIYYKLKISSSDFFYSDNLAEKRNLLELVLKDKGVNPEKFLIAFDYFEKNPSHYDGATIVGDHYTIENLSASALLHDYDTIMLAKDNLLTYWRGRIATDKEYRDNLIALKRKYFINTITAYILYYALIISVPLYFIINKSKK